MLESRDTPGPFFASLCSAALLIDYVLIVAVSVSAGTAALASAVEAITAGLLQGSPLLPQGSHIFCPVLSGRQPSVRRGSVLVAVLSVPVVSVGSSSKRRMV